MSTPDLPYGVLHVVTISCHMEYSIWSFFGAIWSALGFTSEVKLYCHMEYSIWLFYDAIWSTPYGSNSRPYGVLHRALKTSLMELFPFLPQLTWMAII